MEIRLHSCKKHLAIGYYLKIIRDLIRSPKNPFHALYYADLYCGDGECHVEVTDRTYKPPIIDSLLEPAKQGKLKLFCFLNDLEAEKIKNMKEKTKEYQDYIVEYSDKDANSYYKQVLEKIPKDQFSIFFLDPTNHSHLSWKTIQGIAKHTHTYTHQGVQVRRPELIINLMTYTLLSSYRAKSYQSINESLGTDEWFGQIDDNKEKGIDAPVEQAFLSTFIKQLERIGYSVPTPIKITNTEKDNVVYFLIWATNKQGYRIIEKKVIPYIKTLMQQVQKRHKGDVKKAKARKAGNSSLSQWIE